MKKSLVPYQISRAEWIISFPAGSERYGYEEFSNRTYRSMAACRKAIDALRDALPDLLIAAAKVVDCWEGGDLAGAVRKLDQALLAAWVSS